MSHGLNSPSPSLAVARGRRMVLLVMPIRRRTFPAVAAVICTAHCADAWQSHSSHTSSRVRVAALSPRFYSSSSEYSISYSSSARFLARGVDNVESQYDVDSTNNDKIKDFALKDANNLLQPYNRVGGRRVSSSPLDISNDRDTIQSSPTGNDIIRTSLTITAATVLSVLLVDDITMRFETVQDWRYEWPLIGALYVVSGLSSLLSNARRDDEKKYSLLPNSGDESKGRDRGILNDLGDTARELSSFVPLHVPQNRCIGSLAALAGIGVLIGGFIDAFFPVWYTSPDLLGTHAGIEADSAAILLLLTVAGIIGNISDYCAVDNDADESEELGISMIAPSIKNGDRRLDSLDAFPFPSWTLAVVLCTQLWEIASPTFYSYGEMLGIVH